jgi:hypothetical protein
LQYNREDVKYITLKELIEKLNIKNKRRGCRMVITRDLLGEFLARAFDEKAIFKLVAPIIEVNGECLAIEIRGGSVLSEESESGTEYAMAFGEIDFEKHASLLTKNDDEFNIVTMLDSIYEVYEELAEEMSKQ